EVPNARPLTLDGFSRAGAGVFGAMRDDRGAVRPGYFRLDMRGHGEQSAQLLGALATDSAYGHAVLDEVRQWMSRVDLDRPNVRIGVIRPNVEDVPVVVAMAPERGPDGRAVALFGVAYARSAALRTHVGHVLQGVSLLPSPSRELHDKARSDSIKVDNSELAVRLRHTTGMRDPVTPAAANDAVWHSRFIASRDITGPDGGFTVEVAVPDSVGDAYVDAATPLGNEKKMLAGVMLLGFA